jgi:hypothetical protein
LEGVIARCGKENQSKADVSLCCGAIKKSLFRHIEASGVAFGVHALSVSGDNGLKRLKPGLMQQGRCKARTSATRVGNVRRAR